VFASSPLYFHLPNTLHVACFEINTLALVGVKHLSVVPHIRTSTYVRMLAETFVKIRSQHPGKIQIEEPPELRNLVVIDNAEESLADSEKPHIQSMVDWREVPI
jgi:hypothetical protein